MKYKIQLIDNNGFNGLTGTVTAETEEKARELIADNFPTYKIDRVEEVKNIYENK